MHNGGAISATCDYLESATLEDYYRTSGITYSSKVSSTTKLTSITDSSTTTIDTYKFVLKHNYFE